MPVAPLSLATFGLADRRPTQILAISFQGYGQTWTLEWITVTVTELDGLQQTVFTFISCGLLLLLFYS